MCSLSLVAAGWGCSSLWCWGFLLQRILLLQSTSLVVPQHVGYSGIRDQTHAPCIGKWILNYWTTREIHDSNFKVVFLNTLGVLGVGWGEC